MWGPDGFAIDLNSLIDPASGWLLTEAYSINNGNWVSGVGSFDPDGIGPLPAYSRLFMIQVPEPFSLTLLALTFVCSLKHQRRSVK